MWGIMDLGIWGFVSDFGSKFLDLWVYSIAFSGFGGYCGILLTCRVDIIYLFCGYSVIVRFLDC